MKTDLGSIESLESLLKDLYGGEGHLLPSNDGCVGSIIQDNHRPVPLSFKDNHRSTALGKSVVD
jgi:hypothetical protein